ncbi:MAG: serine/threonine protein kinase [Acidobacteria bacterium]|nr:serine/threonine protein kinase [Acidobacteriota bacterium]
MLGPGTILQGRYEIVRLIGHGGMGAVYEALDRRLGDNPVALKQSFFSTELLRRAFEREAILLARLRHSNLPKVFDHFDEAHGQFLVMEYISGPDLEHLMADRGRPFPLETVLDWSAQILDALKYLHTRVPPVIHRDIKPANLKLTTDGQIMLIDFGLAKGQGGTSSIVGYSAHYAPLEQLQREGTGPESDVYSCAATMYRLLTGEPPTTSLIRVTEKAKRRPDPLRPVHEVMPIVPVSIGRVIEHAMELDKEDRLQSAVEMLEALRSADLSIPSRVEPHLAPAVPAAPAVPVETEPPPERVTQYIEHINIDTRPPAVDEDLPASPLIGVEAERGTERITQHIDAMSADDSASLGSRGDYATNIFGPGLTDAAPETAIESPSRRTMPVEALPVGTILDAPSEIPAAVEAELSVGSPPVAPGASLPAYESVPKTSVAPIPDFAGSLQNDAGWRERVLAPDPAEPVGALPSYESPRLTESIPRESNRRLIWIPVAFLLPILAAVWFFVIRSSEEKSAAEPAASAPAAVEAPARSEVIHYGLEIEDSSARLVSEEDFPRGRRFRFHFRSPAAGYLYLIAPDEEKRPTAFLTSDPGPNAIKAGEDFVFPGGDNWINIGEGGDEVRFTVVIAPLRLAQFGFFQQLPRALTQAEISQFENFRKTLPQADVQPDTARGGAMLLRGADASGPAVFDIILRKKK